jgi:hypothetical protein
MLNIVVGIANFWLHGCSVTVDLQLESDMSCIMTLAVVLVDLWLESGTGNGTGFVD